MTRLVGGTGRKILESAVERVPLAEHDGHSGSALERVLLADGTRLVVKRVDLTRDLGARATGDTAGREYRLWREGTLDRLPSGVAHPILTAWRDGNEVVLVMRDVSAGIPGWRQRLSRSECRRVLAAATAMHNSFHALPLAGLCPLAARVTLFAPGRMAPLAGEGPLPAQVLRGWERFAKLAPRDITQAVLDLLEEPSPLVSRLAARPATLLHGDLWLVNLALEPDQVVLFDWGLATWGPPGLEIASFLAGNAAQVQASPELVLEDYRRLVGERHDEPGLRLGLLAGLLELGWNKALHADQHAELHWWLRAAEPGLEALTSPSGSGSC
jgi:Phosphotransferase enzyme family